MSADTKFEHDLAAYRAKHHRAYMARKRQELANSSPPNMTAQVNAVHQGDHVTVRSKPSTVPSSSPPPLRAPLTARTPSVQRQHAASQPNAFSRPSPPAEKTWATAKPDDESWKAYLDMPPTMPTGASNLVPMSTSVKAVQVPYAAREQRPAYNPSAPAPVVSTTRTYVPAQPARRITNPPGAREPSPPIFRGTANAQVAADSELARKLQEEEDARLAASLAGVQAGGNSPTRPPEATFRERLIHDAPTFPAHNLAANPRPVRTGPGNHLTLNANQATVVENIGNNMRTNPLTTYANTRRSPPAPQARVDIVDLDEDEQLRITLAESRKEYEQKYGHIRR